MEGDRDGMTSMLTMKEEEEVVVVGSGSGSGCGKDRLVYMCGYLPGATRQRAPLLSPVNVQLPPSAAAGSAWRDVSGGGCGFAMAISASSGLGDAGMLVDPHGSRRVLLAFFTTYRHPKTDVGQVWGWGYGGEGQLGLGSRIRMVSTPHPIPCIEFPTYANDRSASLSEGQEFRVPGNYIKEIACGGKHSAAITDAGALLTFGWGLYGQCGQGSTDDELSPVCATSLLGIHIQGVAAGLWHTVCISDDGDVYSFGGNQFGQLGTGVDQAEVLPRLLDASSLENIHATGVSCGARHSAVITDEDEVFCWGWNKYGQVLIS
ncbi:hypothetical protein QQ045_015625 [Rhodiola kirilowii]